MISQWKEYYSNRTISPQEAVKHIKSGDRVAIGLAMGEPTELIDAMVENYRSYRDVEVTHMLMMNKGGYVMEGMEPHFRHNSLFVGGAARDSIARGQGDYTPSYFSAIPRFFDSDRYATDVALITVTTPDRHGYCSLGLSVDYTLNAAKNARITIAQVNANLPRTHGDCFLHVSEIDWFVECDRPIAELRPAVLTEVEKSIGRHCASLVKDGATLQLGIGSLPDAVLLSLKDKNDLGLHTEMFSDGAVELMEAGNINGSRKTLHKYKAVATFLMGTKKLYDFVDDNPMVYMAPVDYVNDPAVIGQNDNMVSINACVQVDLMGQVCSESVGLKQISAVGGQVDFVRGARLSRGGISIIALPSTAAGGKISKIVPFLDPGAAVTTNRNDVEYIVTEYGIANMRGKHLRDRAVALINIAHPDFRPALMEEFQRRFHTRFPVD